MSFQPYCHVCAAEVDSESILTSCSHFACKSCAIRIETSQGGDSICPYCKQKCQVIKLVVDDEDFPPSVRDILLYDASAFQEIIQKSQSANKFRTSHFRSIVGRLKQMLQAAATETEGLRQAYKMAEEKHDKMFEERNRLMEENKQLKNKIAEVHNENLALREKLSGTSSRPPSAPSSDLPSFTQGGLPPQDPGPRQPPLTSPFARPASSRGRNSLFEAMPSPSPGGATGSRPGSSSGLRSFLSSRSSPRTSLPSLGRGVSPRVQEPPTPPSSLSQLTGTSSSLALVRVPPRTDTSGSSPRQTPSVSASSPLQPRSRIGSSLFTSPSLGTARLGQSRLSGGGGLLGQKRPLSSNSDANKVVPSSSRASSYEAEPLGPPPKRASGTNVNTTSREPPGLRTPQATPGSTSSGGSGGKPTPKKSPLSEASPRTFATKDPFQLVNAKSSPQTSQSPS